MKNQKESQGRAKKWRQKGKLVYEVILEKMFEILNTDLNPVKGKTYINKEKTINLAHFGFILVTCTTFKQGNLDICSTNSALTNYLNILLAE